jgi:DMSO/TMAO reductase YedYZ molybdopterin-dependent catalytic subunit
VGSCRAIADPSDDTGPSELIIRNSKPLDAESPVSVFEHWRTPNDAFFVRSHFGPPAVGLAPWSIEIGGKANTLARLTLEDLKRLPQVTLPAVLQCSGNGRAFFEPKLPGVPWEKGAVGNAEWTGPRLVDVLKRAGIPSEARHVHLRGGDAPPSPSTPPFLRSIPLARALDPHTLLATEMNGVPLPVVHGGPVRLVVPGWCGNHWIKWLRELTLSADEAPGFFQQTGYRMPKKPAPPDALLNPSDLVPVTQLNVKSLIARPLTGATLKAGRNRVQGVAWTGEGRVERVDVRVGDGPWKHAQLLGEHHDGAWRQWSFDWDSTVPGRYTVAVRATDSNGETQPEKTPWNRSGYLWNAIDRIECEVR